jgi:hypothetical protein
MAINIPSIKRADPVQQGSIGREQVQAPSAEPYIKNLNTIGNVFEKGADLAFKYEKQAQDSTVRDLTNKYKAALYGTGDEKESWTVTRFQKTPKEGQDVTESFVGYQKYKRSLRDQIMSEPNVSSGVAERLKTELADVDFYADRTVNVEFYKANNIKDKSIHDAELEGLLQHDLPNAIATYNPELKGQDQELLRVINKAGLSAAVLNQKMNISTDDPYMNKKVDEVRGQFALIAANDALIQGETKKSKAIYEEFQNIIPDKEANNLKIKLANVEKDKKINDFVDQIMSISAKSNEIEAESQILKLVPEDIQDEVRTRFISRSAQKSEQKSRVSRNLRDAINLKNIQRMSEGKRYSTVEEFKNDPANDWKKVSENLTPADIQSVYNTIGWRNKVGDPEKAYQIHQAWVSGEILSWDKNKFDEETVNLSPKEYNIALRYFTKKDDVGLSQKYRRQIVPNIQNTIGSSMPAGFWNANFGWTPNGKAAWSQIIDPYLDSELDLLPKELSTGEMEKKTKEIRARIIGKLKEAGADPAKFQRLFTPLTGPAINSPITRPTNTIQSTPTPKSKSTNFDEIMKRYETR